MQCQEFERIWIEQSDQALPTAAAAHAAACARCQGMVTDSIAIARAGNELGAEDAAPPEHIWVNVRAQLEAEGLLRTRPRFSWREAWASLFARPALAGAYLALLLIAAVFVGIRGGSGWNTANLEDQSAFAVDRQFQQLQAQAVQMPRRNDPDVSDTLQKNLALVDKFISVCEKTLHEQPQNDLAREYLYGAYQQKAELLAAMTDRGALGD